MDSNRNCCAFLDFFFFFFFFALSLSFFLGRVRNEGMSRCLWWARKTFCKQRHDADLPSPFLASRKLGDARSLLKLKEVGKIIHFDILADRVNPPEQKVGRAQTFRLSPPPAGMTSPSPYWRASIHLVAWPHSGLGRAGFHALKGK